MTLEEFARRLAQALMVCSLVVFIVAGAVAITGDSGQAQLDTLHHFFGLTLAVAGFVLFTVGAALGTLVSAKGTPSPTATRLPENE